MAGNNDFHNYHNNSHLTDNHHSNNHHHSNIFARDRVDSKMSQTAVRNDLSLEHYQHLEQQEQEFNMFLNFEVPKRGTRGGTTTTTFIGDQGGPVVNPSAKGITIDEAFIAAGGFGKQILL